MPEPRVEATRDCSKSYEIRISIQLTILADKYGIPGRATLSQEVLCAKLDIYDDGGYWAYEEECTETVNLLNRHRLCRQRLQCHE